MLTVRRCADQRHCLLLWFKIAAIKRARAPLDHASPFLLLPAANDVWIAPYLCVSVQRQTHTEAPFFCGFGKASCWNRVPLYVRNVCQTHSHTQAGALTRTSERARAAHAGVSQRLIHSFSASLQQVREAPKRQKCPQNQKKGCFHISLF